nr:hypothetical protein Iba_chr02eCG4840 [Ipomoea batatas]
MKLSSGAGSHPLKSTTSLQAQQLRATVTDGGSFELEQVKRWRFLPPLSRRRQPGCGGGDAAALHNSV